jgi:hypothetical protein
MDIDSGVQESELGKQKTEFRSRGIGMAGFWFASLLAILFDQSFGPAQATVVCGTQILFLNSVYGFPIHPLRSFPFGVRGRVSTI